MNRSPSGILCIFFPISYLPPFFLSTLLCSMPAMQQSWVRFLDWEDPLEKEMATHSSIRAWKIPWTEESGWVAKVRHNLATWQPPLCSMGILPEKHTLEKRKNKTVKKIKFKKTKTDLSFPINRLSGFKIILHSAMRPHNDALSRRTLKTRQLSPVARLQSVVVVQLLPCTCFRSHLFK